MTDFIFHRDTTIPLEKDLEIQYVVDLLVKLKTGSYVINIGDGE